MQHTAGADRLRKRLGRRDYEIFRTTVTIFTR